MDDAIDKAIAYTGATSLKQMGAVVKAAKIYSPAKPSTEKRSATVSAPASPDPAFSIVNYPEALKCFYTPREPTSVFGHASA